MTESTLNGTTGLVLLYSVFFLAISLETKAQQASGPNNSTTQFFADFAGDDSQVAIAFKKATSSASFGIRKLATLTSFGDKMYFIGGIQETTNNDVFSSSDGKSWVQIPNPPFGTRCAHASIVFQNRLWVMGGFDATQNALWKDVWSSSDGVNWGMNAVWSFHGRETQAVVLGDRMWIVGGRGPGYLDHHGVFNDVWGTPDGAGWSEAPYVGDRFTLREMAAILTFKGRMWVIGGQMDGVYFSDAWSSSDGSQWKKAVAKYPARWGHRAVVFNKRVYLMGGASATEVFQDIWSTADGVKWAQGKKKAAFHARLFLSLTTFQDRIWIAAGTANDSNLASSFNDVWFSNKVNQTTPLWDVHSTM